MSGSIDHSNGRPSEVESEKTAFDPDDFNPDGEELAFLKSQTGIDNEDALRGHCFKVQASAYEVRHRSGSFMPSNPSMMHVR